MLSRPRPDVDVPLHAIRDPDTGQYVSVAQVRTWDYAKLARLSDLDAEYVYCTLDVAPPAPEPAVFYGLDRGDGGW